MIFRESTDRILPNLDEIQQEIRRIAFDINKQEAGLQNATESQSSHHELHCLNNLRNCVKSAASIVSSASSMQSVDRSNRTSVAHESDFGDCFPPEPAEVMRRWISSNTVYEFHEKRASASSLSGPNAASRKSLDLFEKSRDSDQSDSDGELEVEIIQSLLNRGKDKLASQEFETAERNFRNCLTRSANISTVSLHRLLGSKTEIMDLLLITYRHQEKWDEARSLLMEKLALEPRGSSKANRDVLADTLILVEVLFKKNAYAEALLYGRRALKGYRKMGPHGTLGVQNSLELLCQVCQAAGNHDEEDAYSAILSDLLRKAPRVAETTISAVPEQSPISAPSSKLSSLEKGLYTTSPSVQSLGYQDSLRSSSSWASSNQSTTTLDSLGRKIHRRNSSLSSFGSSEPASPYTTYSSSSVRSQESFRNSKDHQLPRLEDVLPSQSPPSHRATSNNASNVIKDGTTSRSLSHLPNSNLLTSSNFKSSSSQAMIEDDDKASPTSSLTKFVNPNSEDDIAKDVQQFSDHAPKVSITTLAKSSPSLPVPELDHPKKELALLKEQNDSITLQIQESTCLFKLVAPNDNLEWKPEQFKTHEDSKNLQITTTPNILSPPNVQNKFANSPEEPDTSQRATSRSEKSNIKTKQLPGRKLFATTVNHASTHYEVAAIEYLRANKGNPSMPLAKAPIHVSDYELLEWIGTHPDYPFNEQLVGRKFSETIANHASTHYEVAAIEYFRAHRENPPMTLAKAPLHASDYELLEWIGTHPDYPFGNQPRADKAQDFGTALEVPPKMFPKSRSTTDLFNSGILELPVGVLHKSKSTVNLHAGTFADITKAKSTETTSIIDKKKEWELFFASLDIDTSTGTRERKSTLPPLPPRPKAEVTLNTVRNEDAEFCDDDEEPYLKTLMAIGYPRRDAMFALERYDYNIEKVRLKRT